MQMPLRAKFQNKLILTNTTREVYFKPVAFITSTGIEKKKNRGSNIFFKKISTAVVQECFALTVSYMDFWLDFSIAWFRDFTQIAHKLMQAEPNFIKRKLHQSNRASSGFIQTIIIQQVCICITTFTHGLLAFHVEHMISKQKILINIK